MASDHSLSAPAASRAAPNLDVETPEGASASEMEAITSAFTSRHQGKLDGTELSIAARWGAAAAWLEVSVGPSEERYQLQAFVRDAPNHESSLNILIDYLDAVLDEWLEDRDPRALPLDYEGRPYELESGSVCHVLIRGELRNLDAEQAADAWLAKALPSEDV